MDTGESMPYFLALCASHEAEHIAQILNGELTVDDVPKVHEGYQRVKDVIDDEFRYKISTPDVLRMNRYYYGKEGVAHPLEVQAVKASFTVLDEMDYLSKND